MAYPKENKILFKVQNKHAKICKDEVCAKNLSIRKSLQSRYRKKEGYPLRVAYCSLDRYEKLNVLPEAVS